MSLFTLTKTRFAEGHWEGVLKTQLDGAATPKLVVTHLERPIDGVILKPAEQAGEWSVRVPIPADTIGDGVQTFLIRDASSNDTLQAISLIGGDALADDIRAEMDLLRAELDMLKRAFRRHCLETS